MVVKSSPFTFMHIFTRTSSRASMSHADAWQITSRSAGLVNCDRVQKVGGSGANPSDE